MKTKHTSPAVRGISIKQYLADNGIAQLDLANALHLSESVMSRKLCNVTRITLAEYIAICAWLNVPSDFFLPDTQDPEVRRQYRHPCEEVVR